MTLIIYYDYDTISNSSSTRAWNATTNSPLSPAITSHSPNFLIWLILVLSANLFGAITNLLIAIATLTYRPIRCCSSSGLIAHCASLDVIRSIIVYPGLSLIAFLGPYHHFPQSACRYVGGLAYILVYTTNWAYCCLGVHRLCAVALPHHFRYLTQKSAVAAINLFPWLLSALLALFPFFGIGVEFVYTQPWNGCVIGPLGDRDAGFVLAMGTFLQSAISLIAHAAILMQVRMSARNRRRRVTTVKEEEDLRNQYDQQMITLNSEATQRRYDISRMLFVCSVWTFVVSLMLPLVISWAPAYLATNYPAQTWLRFLQFLSSAFNPVFFLLVSSLYRAGEKPSSRATLPMEDERKFHPLAASS
ncbi:hypothetical protein BV898_02374 [Hypsibius exemplaris]|uniref:G-protein coupled receptors family 1 profile domain-containing protein n=1 Tax=Hypsibius exemplaris TaxID=2072580 RepID=A0A1W0X8N4_HYPEX|nr:hypothetical protein BV898_02374 [Hypsibius exemplaris]